VGSLPMSLLCARLQVLKLGARTQLTVRAVEGQRLIGPWVSLSLQRTSTIKSPSRPSRLLSSSPPRGKSGPPHAHLMGIVKNSRDADFCRTSGARFCSSSSENEKPKKAFRSPYHLYYAHTSSQWARESKDGKKKGMMQQIANEWRAMESAEKKKWTDMAQFGWDKGLSARDTLEQYEKLDPEERKKWEATIWEKPRAVKPTQQLLHAQKLLLKAKTLDRGPRNGKTIREALWAECTPKWQQTLLDIAREEIELHAEFRYQLQRTTGILRRRAVEMLWRDDPATKYKQLHRAQARAKWALLTDAQQKEYLTRAREGLEGEAGAAPK